MAAAVGARDRVGRRGGGPRSSRFLRPERVKEVTLLGIIVVSVVVFAFLIDGYLSGRFFNRVTTSVVIVALLAAAQALVIISRNIDLSVGSIVGCRRLPDRRLPRRDRAGPRRRDPGGDGGRSGPRIGQWAAGRLRRGPGDHRHAGHAGPVPHAAQPLLGRGQHPRRRSASDWVLEFNNVTLFTIGGFEMRLVFVIAVVVVLVLQVGAGQAALGEADLRHRVQSVRSRQAGLPAASLVFWSFVGSGALAGLAGFMFMARAGTISATAGAGLELESVAAAVVGGVSILGGSGTMIGALLGAMLHRHPQAEPGPGPRGQRVLARRLPRDLDPGRGDPRHRPPQAFQPPLVGGGPEGDGGHAVRPRWGCARARRWR